MDINQIFENNKTWKDAKKANDPNYFTELSKGQEPKILYVGCSDSRVPAESIMGAEPGEVFVHRNVANMMTNDDLNAMSVLEYAVAHLEVDHIVICGHTHCGGVAASMSDGDLGLLNPYIRNVRDVSRLHKAELDACSNHDDKYNKLIELNVQEQCINVMKTPVFQAAAKARTMKVHGWVFDIGTGELKDLKLDTEALFAGIDSVYKVG